MIRRPPRSTLFPTRRSSDLQAGLISADGSGVGITFARVGLEGFAGTYGPWGLAQTRSEEHTSELQSQSNLVCRLLLEKKKKAEDKRNLETNLANTSATRRLS